MSIRTRFLTSFATASLLFGAVFANAAVKYVSPSGNDANDGSTWALAKATPQAAVTAATTGDQVWVQTGTYTMSSSTALVTLKAGVSLYGGFAGTETTLSQRNAATAAANTIFDGNALGSVVKATGTLTVATIIDGFTVRNGKGSSGGGGFYFSSNGSVTLQNLIVTNNLQTSFYGGGIYAGSTYPTIQNCTISNNTSGTSTGYGGGMYINSATNPTYVLSCIITGNMSTGSTYYGGAGYLSGSATTVANCLVSGNSAGYGGGFYVSGASKIWNNTIVNNTSRDTTATSNFGGGLRITSSSASVGNNIIANNIGGGVSASSTPTVFKNNDIYSNTLWSVTGFTPDATNLAVDPGFNNPSGGDYTLGQSSGVVDAGSAAYVYGAVDLAGNPRVYGGAPDMGAYERQSPITQAPAPGFSILSGTYNNYQTVTITAGAAGETIYYTTDGSTPTNASPTIVSGGTVAINTSQTLQAFATKPGLTDSPVTSATYTLVASTPTFSPDASIAPQTVTITSATTGANIYYTTDGSTPSATNGTLYTAPVVVSGPATTLKAIALKTGMNDSGIKSALYRSSSTIIYVDGAVGNDANDGSSWATAKKTLTAALPGAYVVGDQVWVTSGTYTERVTLKSGVQMYGGFLNGQTLANRNFRTNVTTINGSAGGICITVQSQSGNNTLIDGFTITNGGNTSGAGIYCSASSPTIQNNVITGNNGGGGYGGAIYATGAPTSLAPIMILNNYMSNNQGTGALYGGSVGISSTNAVIVNNVMTGTTAGTSQGAGLWISCSSTYNVKVINNTIAYNNSTGSGGGVYISSSPVLTMANNNIAFNTATTSGQGIYSSVALAAGSSVINNNVYSVGATSNVSGITLGPSNLTLDPSFVSSTNFQLTGASALIDAGDDASYAGTYPTTDAAGNTRFKFSHIDIGAYENQTGAAQTGAPSFNPNGGVSPATVTITSPTSGATIYYTLDGSTPTTSSPSIANGGTVNVPAGSYTLKAAAKAPGLALSPVTSANFRSAITYYVDTAIGSDSNDGLSWATPKKTITAGIPVSSIVGDQVWVAKGTYNEAVTLKDGVPVYGGFINGQTLANRNFRLNVSTIDMTGVTPAGAAVTAPSGITNATILDGFTITGGTNSGLRTTGGSPTVRNVIFTNNSASSGGGIYVSNLSGQDVLVYNCTFLNNTCTSYGGGIYFSSSAHATVVNSLFNGNVGGSYGGGIEFESGSVGKVINCTFYGNSLNSTTQNGGAIDVFSATATLANNIIFNNTASNGGGLSLTGGTTMAAVTSKNNDIYGNNGAGTAVDYTPNYTPDAGTISADPMFTNAAGGDFTLSPSSPCVNAGDNASYSGTFPTVDLAGNPRIYGTAIDIGAYESQVAPNITFTGTVKLQGYVGATLPTVTVTVDGGTPQTVTLTPVSTNTGTFTVPLSASAGHTVRVKPNGFLSQTATLTAGTTSFTFDGGSATSNAGLIPGDANNDNIIEDTDLLAVINNFLSSPPTGNADFNGDLVVDDTDLLDVINNFLAVGN